MAEFRSHKQYMSRGKGIPERPIVAPRKQQPRAYEMEAEFEAALDIPRQISSEERGGLAVLAKVENNDFVVDSDALYQFLRQPELEGRPLVIISISGAFRSGKSFIMNFFLRYLRNKGWRNENWFGDSGTEITGGFPWRRGEEACTKGITVWPEVFTVPTTDGRQAAVIIADTQGLFDDDTSPDINAKLMSLSTLFCSHQILNLMRQIEERDLEHLQLCIAFAKVAASIGRGADRNPFQNLTFLVRDWEHQDNFGDGTSGYLRRYFSKKSKSSEVQKVKDSITTAFDRVRCTLLPHPGKKVIKQKPDYVLVNADIDEEFQEHVSNFVSGILHPENLVVKRTKDGKEETTTGLINLLATVGNAFEAGKVPTAETLLASVVRGNNTKALITAVAEYRKNMGKVCNGILDCDELNKHHENSWKIAQSQFHSVANIGGEESKAEFLVQLREECETALKDFTRRNDAKKSQKLLEIRKLIAESLVHYADRMKKIETSVDEAGFDMKHKEYQQNVMSDFDAATHDNRKAIPDIENLRKDLVQSISSSYVEAKHGWKERKSREQDRNKEKCSSLRFSLKTEFENDTQKHEKQFVPDLERILRDTLHSALSRYDDRLRQNPEKAAVLKNRRLFEQDMKQIVNKALRYNSGQRELKISSLRVLVDTCASAYRGKMLQLGLDVDEIMFKKNHVRHQRECLEEFDNEARGQEKIYPEIKEFKKTLMEKISQAYDEMQQNREREKSVKQAQSRQEANQCMLEVLDEFRKEAQKHENQFGKKVEESLLKLKERYISEYNVRMAQNPEHDAVEKNKKSLEREIDSTIKTVKVSSDAARSAKTMEFRSKIRECLSLYRSKMKNADLDEHDSAKDSAIAKFDDATQGFGDEFVVNTLRLELDDKIEFELEKLETTRRREQDARKAEARESCVSGMYDALNEFRKDARKLEGNYMENIGLELSRLKENCVAKYTTTLRGNTETDMVEKNKRILESEIDETIQRVESSNNNAWRAKVSRFRVKMRACLSDYERDMKYAAMSKHEQFKKKALRAFDDETSGFKDSPDVAQLTIELEDEIDSVKERMEQLKQAEERAKENEERRSEMDWRERVIDEFESEVRMYRTKYVEDLESTLNPLVQRYKNKYSSASTSNRYGNAEHVEAKLNKIAGDCFQANKANKDNYRQEVKNLGEEYVSDLEDRLREVMGETYVEMSALDTAVTDFKQYVREDGRYKELPDWGKGIVDRAIQGAVARVKAENEKNKKYRSAKVSKPGVLKWFRKKAKKAGSWMKKNILRMKE